MEYRKDGNFYLLRLDKGEEILESLHHFCCEENILCATVSGIGAVNEVTVGLFETANKKYHSQTYQGDMEITSLCGNISRMNGEPYLHLHINVSDRDDLVRGGHLNRAVISVTGELVVQAAQIGAGRAFSEEIGTNLISF